MLSDRVWNLTLPQAPRIGYFSRGGLEKHEIIIATHLRLKGELALSLCVKNEALGFLSVNEGGTGKLIAPTL